MIIVGLGNPEKKYFKTRHNVGFRFVDKIAEEFDVKFKLNKNLNGMVAEFVYNNEKHILLKPITYMNNSGISVSAVLNYYKQDISELLVIYDDMDLNLGVERIRKFGSSGGHNGMKSIIEHLNSQDFKRIRIGIGHPENNEIDYVLGKFNKQEEIIIQGVIDQAPNIVKDYLNHGIDYIMNNYNNWYVWYK